MPNADLFANAKPVPYWWEAAPRPASIETALPQSVDVLVIGAGYTGLSAARETAHGGRSTLVIDAEELGWGCSSRNGGQASTSIKPSFDSLSGHYNQDLAFRIRCEGMNALDYTKVLIANEKLDVDWREVGRYHAAHTKKNFDEMAAFAKAQPPGLEVPMEIVSKAEQPRELVTPRYHGGAVFPRHAALQPAKYVNELIRLARSAGATLIGQCRALGIEKDGKVFRVKTSRGDISARDVLVATNGYTPEIFPWQRRRVIPIGSYILATEPIPGGAKRFIPKDRVVSDTRRVVIYYRSSPDGERIIFGGRAKLGEKDPLKCLPRLHQMLTWVHPELAETPVSHAWMGFVAYTFDKLPHLGKQDGLWYCMGYCGSGVTLAGYFGMRIGQQILGLKEGHTALDSLSFATRPLYDGRPWFLAPSVAAYRALDALGV